MVRIIKYQILSKSDFVMCYFIDSFREPLNPKFKNGPYNGVHPYFQLTQYNFYFSSQLFPFQPERHESLMKIVDLGDFSFSTYLELFLQYFLERGHFIFVFIEIFAKIQQLHLKAVRRKLSFLQQTQIFKSLCLGSLMVETFDISNLYLTYIIFGNIEYHRTSGCRVIVIKKS